MEDNLSVFCISRSSHVIGNLCPLFIDKLSTVLEDNNVLKKRGYNCPEDTSWAILSVKKWTFFLGVLVVGSLARCIRCTRCISFETMAARKSLN